MNWQRTENRSYSIPSCCIKNIYLYIFVCKCIIYAYIHIYPYINLYRHIYIIYIIFHTLNPCVLFVSRWMNGPFEELDGMSLETNLDDFFRDIFKMLKFFQQKQNRDEKDAEKVFRKTGDDEPKKQESPSVVLCSAVMEQIKEFKVKRVIIMMRKHQASSPCDTE